MMIPPRWAQPPEGGALVRVGRWYWYRDDEGELREIVLPDLNFGAVTEAEVERILRTYP